MALPLLPTTVVGSYPQPDWLVDRDLLKSQGVARVRRPELWRVAEPWLQQAQDDATIVAIRDMESAGIDIITDGEIRRESYSNRFATALEGVDVDSPGFLERKGRAPTVVPRVVGPIRRTAPVEVRDMAFLRRNTDRVTKITLPGPFTIAQQCKDEFYGDDEALTMAFAEAVNAEARDLEAAGADVIQIDEPWLRRDPGAARRYALKAINRALEGLSVTTALHLCFGYAHLSQGMERPHEYQFLTELSEANAAQLSIESAQPKLDLAVLDDLPKKVIMLGVIDLSDPNVEPVEVVAGRIRAALEHLPPERLVVAPDCGMKYLPRDTARGKLRSLSDAARLVRAELQ